MTTPPNDPGRGQPSGTFGHSGQNPGGYDPDSSRRYGRGISGSDGPADPPAGYVPRFAQQGPSQPAAAQPGFGQTGQPGHNYYAAQQPGQQGPARADSTGYSPGQQRRFAGAYRPQDPQKLKRRRLIAVIVIVAVVLGIGGYLFFNWFTSRNDERDSQAAMNGLLTALQAGDATAALSYLDPGSIAVDGQPLLTDAAIANNPNTFAFNPNFVSSKSGGGYSHQASVQINGTTRVVQWDVKEIDGTWKVEGADVLGQINLGNGQSVQINGIAVGPGPTTLSALPGSYTASSELALLSFAPSQADFDIFTGGQTSIDAELIVADGVQEQVVDQVREILNGCVAAKASPGTCNWAMTFSNGHAVDGTITWTLSPDDPASQITVPTTGWTAAEAYTQTFALRYQTIAAGEGQLDDGSRGKFDGYTATRTSYFSLDLSGDTPVIRLVS